MINTLVEYKGGGYDGCFWEWNYAFIDKGQFYDIFSSGYAGCKTKEQLYARVLRNKELEENSDFFLYKIRKKSEENEIIHFIKNSSLANVYGVATWFYANFGLADENKREQQFKLIIECSICSEKNFIAEMKLEGMYGIGGIAVDHKLIVCYDCIEKNTCEKCHSFFEDRDNFKNDVCEYCQEETKENNE